MMPYPRTEEGRQKEKAYQVRYRASRDKAIQTAHQARYRASEKGVTTHREGHLQYRYKLTISDWESLAQSQGNACAICKQALCMGRDTHVDHDHACCPGLRTCGKCIRGLLCRRCNILVGSLEHPLMGKALDYLGVP